MFPNGGQNTTDVEWIEWAAHNGCIGVTVDKAIGRTSPERDAVMTHGLQLFVLLVGNLNTARREQLLHLAAHRMASRAKKPGPWADRVGQKIVNDPFGPRIAPEITRWWP